MAGLNDGFKAKLTFFVNPRQFYVSKYDEEEAREKIDFQICRLLERDALQQPKYLPQIQPPDLENSLSSLDSNPSLEVDLMPGDLVLAWSRSRPATPIRGRILASVDEPNLGLHFKVDFIDFGFQQWVHLDDIFYPPDSIKDIEPLAIKCCLDGIFPNVSVSGDGWSKEAIDEFEELTTTENGM